jgi:lysozyme
MNARSGSLKELLIKHEDVRLKPYPDTAGKLTIGVGRNLVDKGLTYKEAMYLLDNDIADTTNDCLHAFPWFADLTQERQWVIISMVFNMGLAGVQRFTRMLAAIELGDYSLAAKEMGESRWAKQVGSRADELKGMMYGPQ